LLLFLFIVYMFEHPKKEEEREGLLYLPALPFFYLLFE